MKARFVLPLALIAMSAVAFQQATYPPYVTDKTLYAKNDLRGKPAPALYVQKWLTSGKVDTKGKVVLIDFWATWCPPCRALIPELNGYAKKYEGKVVVIGISDEPASTVAEFMKKTSMNYNVGIDTTKKMASVLGVQGIPHCILISPDGIVRWQGFPLDDADKLTDKIIDQVLAASGVK
ncbi:MAG TPA: TlpA disulfide reductase family protein [Fimbriimonadaceae bacterium]|nr:TlpA disulfide reductase family protein [Fimbriimonadaceae bacterium]